MRYIFERLIGWCVIISILIFGWGLIIRLGEHLARNFNYYKYLITK